MRLERFERFRDDPWLGAIWAKLNEAQRDFCRAHLILTEKFTAAKFVDSVNRLFLDRPRGKGWQEITELLLATR